jgi:hypothetical protein
MNSTKSSLVMNLGFAYDNLMDDCVSEDRRQRLNLQSTFRRHSGVTPGVMVWGAIHFGSRSLLVFI